MFDGCQRPFRLSMSSYDVAQARLLALRHYLLNGVSEIQ